MKTKTIFAWINARKFWIELLGHSLCPVVVAAAGMHPIAVHVQQTVAEQFATVGDFPGHPVNGGIQGLMVRSTRQDFGPTMRTSGATGGVVFPSGFARCIVGSFGCLSFSNFLCLVGTLPSRSLRRQLVDLWSMGLDDVALPEPNFWAKIVFLEDFFSQIRLAD